MDLNSVNAYYEDFSDYRLWLTLSQQQMDLKEDGSGEFQSAMDYLRNGLKEIPLNPELLFNYANCNERLGKHKTAVKFFRFAQIVREGWSDAYFGEAVSHFEQQYFLEAKRCVKKAIYWSEENAKNHSAKDHVDSKEDIQILKYFQAMCYKNLKKFDKA